MKEYEVLESESEIVVYDNFAEMPFCVCESVIDAHNICNVLNNCNCSVYGGELATVHIGVAHNVEK